MAAVVWATAVPLGAQTETTLLPFDMATGTHPVAPLLQGTDGFLWATLPSGGSFPESAGSVLAVSTTGAGEPRHKFQGMDGSTPLGGLVESTKEGFYGTTSGGGTGTCSGGCGTVFEVTPSSFTTLHVFSYTDGWEPQGNLIQATDGNFYGTTVLGGAGSCLANGQNEGCGTIFKMTAKGALTTLYNFCALSNCSDGSAPYGGLIQANDENFYGVTADGGANPSCSGLGAGSGCGTVFKITTGGKLTTLYSFCSLTGCADGQWPTAALVQGSDGNFYGATNNGGNFNASCADGCGTIFKITPAGVLTTLHAFCATGVCADGEYPSGLVQGTDGNFYGATESGGTSEFCGGCGTLFSITPGGTLTTLYNFCAQKPICPDGKEPLAALIQDTSGTFYGTASQGGGNIEPEGTVFSLSMGLGPFVKTLPVSGKTGAVVHILGTNLTGATEVTFNGTPAKFTVTSSSYITTNVPAGGTTGTVQVATPGGTLSSNVPFRVIQ